MADEKIIDFMGWRKPVGGFSIVLMVVAVLAIALRGFNLGLDFSGGSLIELHFSQPADPQQVRDYPAWCGSRCRGAALRQSE
jgi:preprotein translocase subunit SecF